MTREMSGHFNDFRLEEIEPEPLTDEQKRELLWLSSSEH